MKCAGCEQTFDKSLMVKLGTRNFCPQCFEKNKPTYIFFNYICEIFCLKSPGPRIYKERQRLNLKGISDEEIKMTLDYLYNVKKIPIPPRDKASLWRVSPETVEEAKRYFARMDNILHNGTKIEEVSVKIKPQSSSRLIDLDNI